MGSAAAAGAAYVEVDRIRVGSKEQPWRPAGAGSERQAQWRRGGGVRLHWDVWGRWGAGRARATVGTAVGHGEMMVDGEDLRQDSRREHRRLIASSCWEAVLFVELWRVS